MNDSLTIALAQLNPTVGDIAGNLARARSARGRGAERGADLVVLSELFITGYPPEDLILKPAFQKAAEEAVADLAGDTVDGPALLLGAPWRDGGDLYNAALLLEGGVIAARRYKHALPNYGVFDEKRLFAAGPLPGPINFRGVRLGVMVCEDMWTPDVAECLQETGAEILVVGNGSPFESDKLDERMNLALARVVETGLPLIYLNQVGGQDELVFDGGSFVLGSDRTLNVQAPSWCEDVRATDWRRNGDGSWQCESQPAAAPCKPLKAVYQAMVLGLRDYVNKNRFPGVVLGLSGGIDSALSAVVATDALGAARVRCLVMPSPYTARSSIDDAEACAAALGIRADVVPIDAAMEAHRGMLAALFAGREPDVTEENIQARIRGMTVMAFSNKFGHMALTTGNKSEMSVGYATLYGDMCGGYSVLKDVYKTAVYELARWRNANLPDDVLGPGQRVIPETILAKAPSAELRPGQTDQDTLPPYDRLDDILECLVEREMALDDIVARGHGTETVAKVARMLHVAEYKRRQAPPGVKITRRSFGRDRRYPITNAYLGVA